MCPISHAYTLSEVQAMTLRQIGQAIYEYENEPDSSEMLEMYGSVDAMAEGVVDCFVDTDGYVSEPVQYILDMGRETLLLAVEEYLEVLFCTGVG